MAALRPEISVTVTVNVEVSVRVTVGGRDRGQGQNQGHGSELEPTAADAYASLTDIPEPTCGHEVEGREEHGVPRRDVIVLRLPLCRIHDQQHAQDQKRAQVAYAESW